MLCQVSNYGMKRHPPGVEVHELMGTWDFKWPRYSIIRVALQDPVGGGSFDRQALGVIQKKIADWNRATKNLLKLTLVPERLQAPRQAATPDQPGTAESVLSPEETSKPLVRYDALVSASPLPILKAATRTQPIARQIDFPAASLGTYCRRPAYGTPTVFIGRPASWAGGDDATWFKSPEFGFVVLHELGHVLGLVHEPQNPKRQVEAGDLWKDPDDIVQIVAKREGVTWPEEKLKIFVESQITGRWPGALAYSDWRKPGEQASSSYIDSVMAKPLHGCLLKSTTCTVGSCTDRYRHEHYDHLGEPRPWDIEQLQSMYAPSR